MGRKMKMELVDYYQRCNGNDDDGDGDGVDRKDLSNTNQSSLLESLWNTTEYLSIKDLLDCNMEGEEGDSGGGAQLGQILFEMSLTNPDKPSMDPNEVARRIEFFNKMIDGDEKERDADDTATTTTTTSSCTMPDNWGILLTSAPLFIDKVRLLREYLAPSGGTYGSGNTHGNSGQRRRLMTFVIGTDTMVRIIDPKYYDNNIEKMLGAVREMGDLGAHFVVGGRLEQSKTGDPEEKIFVTGEDELVGLPKDVREMFTIIKEEDFRIDVSSSEIRARNS